MKKITLSVLFLPVMTVLLSAQTYSDEKVFTFDVDQIDLIRLHNKHGEVTVKGTNDRRATLKVKRFFKSTSQSKLASAKKEIFLDSTHLDGELMFYLKHPDYRLEINENGRAYYNHFDGNWNNKDDIFYKVKVEFTIELSVPKNTELYVSTHTKNLSVKNINADVLAQNHHGHIALEAIGGNVQAHTHHGKIQVGLTKAPTRDASFDTHHGNIEVSFPKNLSADVELKTRHGNFYTDFDYQAKAMPVSLNKSKSRKGTKYKVNSGTNIRIGNGGPKLNFETYHGSIYLLK